VKREDQDLFALRSQHRAVAAQKRGYFDGEIVAVEVPGGKAGPVRVDKDEHPRSDTTLQGLAKLRTPFRNPGTVTAGNASGVNDGAAALVIASEEAAKANGLKPRARILGLASARLRSAIRLECQARALRARPCERWKNPAASMVWRRCASVSGRAWRLQSSAFDA